MSNLKYHQDTFDMLGLQAQQTRATLEAVDDWERKNKRKLPGALREWFAVEGTTQLLERYSNQDNPKSLDKLEYDPTLKVKRSGEEVPVLTVVAFDDDEVLETSDREGWYFFLGENQGCCAWVVRDDGTDDPPVFVSADSFIISEWPKVSEHLSTFLFDWIASYRYQAYSAMDQVKVLVARDRLPNDEELIRLRADWRDGPPWAHPDALTHYRFFRSNAILKIGIWQEDEELTPQPRWQLNAANAEALAESAKLLWPLAFLASTLRPAFYGDTVAQGVLASLGQVRTPPQTAWDYYDLAEEKRLSDQPGAIAEALDLFARAIQLDPTLLGAHQRRVYCYQKLEDHQAIVSEYTAMLALREDPFSRIRRAEHLSKLGRHEEAAQDLCDVIRIDADYANFLAQTQPFRDAGRLDLVRLVMESWRDHSPRGHKHEVDEYFANESN